MNTFKQISEKEWIRADYRPAAEILRDADDLFPNIKVDFCEYEDDGIGRMKIAYFLTSNNRQFYVEQHVEYPFAITIIGLLNDKKTYFDDLEEVLELMHLEQILR